MCIANHGRGNRIGNVGHQKTEGGDNSETERPAGESNGNGNGNCNGNGSGNDDGNGNHGKKLASA